MSTQCSTPPIMQVRDLQIRFPPRASGASVKAVTA